MNKISPARPPLRRRAGLRAQARKARLPRCCHCHEALTRRSFVTWIETSQLVETKKAMDTHTAMIVYAMAVYAMVVYAMAVYAMAVCSNSPAAN